MKAEKTILGNGLTVITVPTQSATVASVFASEAGGYFDYQDREGLAHFVEHMVFKGTEKFPSAKKVIEVSEGIGGEINAGTGQESMTFYIQTPPEMLSKGIDWLSEVALRATFPKKEFEKEKAVVIEEARMYIDNHQQYAYVKAMENLYNGTRWAKPIEGYEATIKNIEHADLARFYSEMFSPKTSVLVVFGNFDTDIALKSIESTFGNWKSNAKKEPPKERKKKVSRFFVEERAVNQVYLTVATKSIKATDPRYIPALISKQILGGGMGSKLNQGIRDKHGLCYYIFASISGHKRTGYSIVSSGLNIEKISKAGKLIRNEINDLLKGKITAKELNRAKKLTKTAVLSLFDSPVDAGHKIADSWLDTKEIELAQDLSAKIDAVGMDSVVKASKKAFNFSGGVVSVVSPKGLDVQKLTDIL